MRPELHAEPQSRRGATAASSGPAETVLIVDDEPDLQQLLLFNLGETGLIAEAVGTGREALDAATRLRPRVVVLDVMLPDVSGIEVCRKLRADPSLGELGILMLTARGNEFDRVLGLEAGADDYVVKPFSVRELVLRVRALVRRSNELRENAKPTPNILSWGELVVDRDRCSTTLRGVEVGLRRLEFRMLVLFLAHPGRVFTRRELFEQIWGTDHDGNTRTVITHLQRLRERLADHGSAIETVHGFGYRLREP